MLKYIHQEYICSHDNTVILDRVYREAKFFDSVWQEKQCKDCGKILAKRWQYEAWSDWKEEA